MHELAVADVNPDVGVAFAVDVEEYEIARPELLARDRSGGGSLVDRHARQLHADERVAVLHQPAAVEAARRIATPDVGRADHIERVPRRVGADVCSGLLQPSSSIAIRIDAHQHSAVFGILTGRYGDDIDIHPITGLRHHHVSIGIPDGPRGRDVGIDILDGLRGRGTGIDSRIGLYWGGRAAGERENNQHKNRDRR